MELRHVGWRKNIQKAPIPMEMAPAISSAIPPSTTTLEFPRDAKPAVRAKGTVNPSDRPITLSKEVNDA